MSANSLASLLLAGLNTVSSTPYAALPLDSTVEQIGLDSISLSQLVLFIEDQLDRQIPDAILMEISQAKTVGDIVAAIEHAEGDGDNVAP